MQESNTILTDRISCSERPLGRILKIDNVCKQTKLSFKDFCEIRTLGNDRSATIQLRVVVQVCHKRSRFYYGLFSAHYSNRHIGLIGNPTGRVQEVVGHHLLLQNQGNDNEDPSRKRPHFAWRISWLLNSLQLAFHIKWDSSWAYQECDSMEVNAVHRNKFVRLNLIQLCKKNKPLY